MPSAYSVPMASDVLPDPDTPTTATVRQSGTSTSISRRLLCRAPRTPMIVGRFPGTGASPATTPGSLRPSVRDDSTGTASSADRLSTASAATSSSVRPALGPALAWLRCVLAKGWTGPLGPESRRSDCMMANVVVVVKTWYPWSLGGWAGLSDDRGPPGPPS